MPNKPAGTAGVWQEVARYPYTDKDGLLLYEVVRYLKSDGTKTFMPIRPTGVDAVGTTDPNRPGGVAAGGIVVGLAAGKYLIDPKASGITGKSTWKRAADNVDHGGAEATFGECPRVPYRLPELLNSKVVYLPEGEKDVHTLEGWGRVSSCNPGGAGNSTLYAEWKEHFRGRHIVILPDNDEPGRKHAVAVALALLDAAASIRILELPGVPEKADVTDWKDAGGTIEQLCDLAKTAAPLDAASLSELCSRWGITGQGGSQGPNSAAPNAGSLATRRLSDIQSKPVRWLWPGRIARGKVNLIAGNPGLGKSQVTASLAAVVTTGGLWPVDRSPCDPGNVVFLNAEDDAADTLRPRLEAAGANLQRVHIVDGVIVGYTGNGTQGCRPFSLEADLEALDATLSQLQEVAMVVIDPITAYLGRIDSHKNAEVRGLLAPLSEIAARHNSAIIGVSHLTKATGPQALMRVTGSLAFVAAARAAYLIAPDPNNPARRLFLPMKNNIGPDTEGLAFCIESTVVSSAAGDLSTSCVAWESEAIPMTADEVLQANNGTKKTSALSEAVDWLKDVLKDGPMAAAKVYDLAEVDGIARKTLQRAAREMGVQKVKESMEEGWTWCLSPKVANPAEDGQQNGLGTFGNFGHLRDSDGMVEEEI